MSEHSQLQGISIPIGIDRTDPSEAMSFQLVPPIYAKLPLICNPSAPAATLKPRIFAEKTDAGVGIIQNYRNRIR